MNEELIIRETERFVRQQLEREYSGHDWYHIHRVQQMAKIIAKEEGANLFICEISALLHDIADEKISGSEQKGIQIVQQWLEGQKVEDQIIEWVIDIISTISFKGGNRPPMRSLEGQVVQDADRLDAIGAVGIARVFAYSGAKGQLIHDPVLQVRENMTYQEYRQGKSTAINHFYEKLLKLKDLMNTAYGKELALERHRFMEQFLTVFLEEWEGIR